MASKTRKLTYPPNWEELARAAKERAGWKCEWCGIAAGTECINAKGKPYRVVLSVHHPDGDTANPDARIVALCSTCHLRDDAAMHARHAQETLQRTRLENALAAGQITWLEGGN